MNNDISHAFGDLLRTESVATNPALLHLQSPSRVARCCSPYLPSCEPPGLVQGVQRISLLGSIVTAKVIPKYVDVLVTIDAAMDLTRLARSGRRLMGQAQTINLGADIFLADTTGRYLGRICRYRECHPRVLCHAQHCGQRDHLNDDLHIVTLSQELIASPPVELWPKVTRRFSAPADVEEALLNKLDQNQ